jgi:DNA-binding Lrp family transcriptional regulator
MDDDLYTILTAIDQLAGDTGRTHWEAIVAATGLSDPAVQQGLRKLYDTGIIVGVVVTGIDDQEGFKLIDLRRRHSGEPPRSTGTH